MEGTERRFKRKSRLAVFEHVPKKEKKPNHKFHTNRLDLGDSSPSESELVIDDEVKPVKKRHPFIKLSEEPLNLVCEWNHCQDTFDSWETFNTHLSDHASFETENLKCQWNGCAAESENVPLLIQHLSFHGYLSKLRNIGQNILNRTKLPPCNLEEYYTIPVLPEGYTCEWEYCSFNFCTLYDFYTHMEIHVKNNPRISDESRNEHIICCWTGCNMKFSTVYKLAEHVRTHTKEKTVACPTCYVLFSNKTKFCDHRKRQLSTDLQSYQCSQCLKLFPTERLLRDHMRSHINHYKCTLCDMTCPKPSILAKHIRFKHVNYKPYKCTQCTKTFVTRPNLLTHLKTHLDDDLIKCEHCDFRCRSRQGLETHSVKVHAKQSLVYECHCCKKKFKRGSYLTKHLMKQHNYHWPSGHSRFRYRKDQDDVFRLQTVRYESLEVTQEMIRSETMPSNSVKPNESYSLKYDNVGQSQYVLSVSETGEQSVEAAESKNNDVLITINDVDEQGNILKSEVVESKVVVDEIEVKEHPLPNISDGNNLCKNSDSIKCEGVRPNSTRRNLRKRVNKETVKVKKEAPESDDIHYFSKEVILNYDKFKIETTKSGY